jgi:protein involved in sex pheromone biosynthesis
MKKFLIVLILSVLFLASCAPEKVQQDIQIRDNVSDVVYRFTDNEANVVCWVYHSSYKGGISCLPISETSLSK